MLGIKPAMPEIKKHLQCANMYLILLKMIS